MSESPDPGLDLHTWRTELEALGPELHDQPEQALPELALLVERMLGERDLHPDDSVVLEDTEQLASYADAKAVADRAAAGADLDPGDVAFAISELRQIAESIVEERRPP